MEQRDIEIFLTLADELHFGRTAERLHVSTARVSQSIKHLEHHVGALLFERTSRRVEPTAIGRRLHADLRPAYQQIQDAIARAVTAARGISGVLRVGFVGAAAGQFVLEVAESFQARHPDCEVEIRENQFGDGLALLRAGEIDMLLAVLPIRSGSQTDIAGGPVLVREDRLLAVSARHRFASRTSVSSADLVWARVLRSPPAVPAYWDESLVPPETPDGRPTERGPVFATVQEMLALVGAGKGTYPVPAHASQFYLRPDVVYVPIEDAPTFEWRFIWPVAAETGIVRAFDRTAAEVAEGR